VEVQASSPPAREPGDAVPSPDRPAPILAVEHLQAHVGAQQVVEDVGFTVARRGVTALLGRNGVGKTSTIKAILGLITRRGSVTFDGERIDGLPTYRIVQRGIGYVPEDREVFAGLTVAENLRLAARDGAPHRERVDALFPDLVARADQRAGSLSGGQQQMVSLARAMLNHNRLLLIDEPTKGLAPLLVGQVADALAAAAAETPILLVEQNLPVVERLADDVVVVDAGRVVHRGRAEELLGDRAMVQRLLGVHRDDPEETPP
jgi:branched-chain amino acid transport system ATP-binding protein